MELPESKTALTGFPSIFATCTGTPRGTAQCTIQPATLAHAPGEGGLVGMGSSTGAGATGLLTGREVPSSGYRSTVTLQGTDTALSPTS